MDTYGSNSNENTYTKGKLGDATRETLTKHKCSGCLGTTWYGGTPDMVTTGYVYMRRGGIYNSGDQRTMFTFRKCEGYPNSSISFRLSLTSEK